MRRLDAGPSDIEVIVCSHGHFDYLTGLDGLIRRLGTVNLPVLIHPHFWRRRRVAIPGRDPQETPTAGRRRLIGAGFEEYVERQPRFPFERPVLVTAEVAPATSDEPGFPPKAAAGAGAWGRGGVGGGSDGGGRGVGTGRALTRLKKRPPWAGDGNETPGCGHPWPAPHIVGRAARRGGDRITLSDWHWPTPGAQVSADMHADGD